MVGGASIQGCADQTKSVFETASTVDVTMEAAISTLRSIGFDVQRSDQNSSTISGTKYSMATWNGKAPVQMIVSVKPVNSRTEVAIEVNPIWGSYGTTAIPFDDYLYALRLLIPDMKLKSVKRDFQFNDLFGRHR